MRGLREASLLEQLCAGADETPVSLGYDRVRFLAPVYFGDTVTVEYKISKIDVKARRSVGDISITNQNGTLVAVAQHILKWVKNKPKA